MTREEGYKITFIVQHKTRAHWKLGPDPAFSLCFHENRGVPNFRPSLLYRIRISFPFLISHPVPNFPRFLGSRQIAYPINLYQIPGIPFQTRGKKSTVICHLFDTGIVVIDLKSATQNLTLWENVGSILAQQVANDNYEDESLTYSLKTAWNSFSVICLSTGRGILQSLPVVSVKHWSKYFLVGSDIFENTVNDIRLFLSFHRYREEKFSSYGLRKLALFCMNIFAKNVCASQQLCNSWSFWQNDLDVYSNRKVRFYHAADTTDDFKDALNSLRIY